MARTRVQVSNNIAKHQDRLEEAVRDSLVHAGQQAAARARSVPTKYQLGSILRSIHPTRTYKTRKGWAVSIIADDWREIFFEKGTLGKRRAKLKKDRRRNVRDLKGGIKAGHFLRKGLKGADEVIDGTRSRMR